MPWTTRTERSNGTHGVHTETYTLTHSSVTSIRIKPDASIRRARAHADPHPQTHAHPQTHDILIEKRRTETDRQTDTTRTAADHWCMTYSDDA